MLILSSPDWSDRERPMKRRGYSLVELLVVVAIIALMAGFLLVAIHQVYGALRRLMELVG